MRSTSLENQKTSNTAAGSAMEYMMERAEATTSFQASCGEGGQGGVGWGEMGWVQTRCAGCAKQEGAATGLCVLCQTKLLHTRALTTLMRDLEPSSRKQTLAEQPSSLTGGAMGGVCGRQSPSLLEMHKLALSPGGREGGRRVGGCEAS